MAVPDHQGKLPPPLKHVSDNRFHALRDVVEALATSFRLSEEERCEMLPSGMDARSVGRMDDLFDGQAPVLLANRRN